MQPQTNVALSSPAQMEKIDSIHKHAARKASFFERCPGAPAALEAMLNAAENFARANNVKVEQVAAIRAGVSSEGVFSCRFVITPFRLTTER